MAEERTRAGNPDEEIGKYLDILSKDPKSRVFAPLAEAYRKAGLLDEAIGIAREGLGNHPSYLSGRVALARALFEKGEFAEARKETIQVVQAAPDNLMAHKLLGQIHLQGGNAEGAEKSFNTVLLLDPRDQEATAALENLKGTPPHAPPPIESGPDMPDAAARGSADVPEGLILEEVQSQPEEESQVSEEPVFDLADMEEGSASAAAQDDAPVAGDDAPFDLPAQDTGESVLPASEFEEDGEETPFEQTFDDLTESSGGGEDDLSASFGDDEPAFVFGDEDELETAEIIESAGAETTDAAAVAEDVPFDLGADDELETTEIVESAGAETTDAAAVAEDIPFDLGADDELETAEIIESAGAETTDAAAVAEDIPFDLGADDELETAEIFESAGAETTDAAAAAEDIPFDLGADDELETAEIIESAGAETTDAAAVAEDIPFDLGADDELETAEIFESAGAETTDAAAAAEDIPFDLGADDELETAEIFESAGAETTDAAAVAEDIPFDLGADDELETADIFESAGAETTDVAEDIPFDLGADDKPETAEIVDSRADERVESAIDAAERAGETESPSPPEAPIEVGAHESREAVKASEEGDAFNTETLAHLYIKQGFYRKAAGVYEAMLRENPDDGSLRQKFEEAKALAGMEEPSRTVDMSPVTESPPTPPQSAVSEDRHVAVGGGDEHPAIVGLRRFLAQLKESQP